MMSEYINAAHPNQTAEQREDRWASLQLHRLKMREISRYDIERHLEAMPEEKRERARHWLNHYREITK